MPDSVLYLAAAIGLMWAGLAAMLFGTITRVYKLERRLRHLHRKQDEDRAGRQAPTPRVRKVAR